MNGGSIHEKKTRDAWITWLSWLSFGPFTSESLPSWRRKSRNVWLPHSIQTQMLDLPQNSGCLNYSRPQVIPLRSCRTAVSSRPIETGLTLSQLIIAQNMDMSLRQMSLRPFCLWSRLDLYKFSKNTQQALSYGNISGNNGHPTLTRLKVVLLLWRLVHASWRYKWWMMTCLDKSADSTERIPRPLGWES